MRSGRFPLACALGLAGLGVLLELPAVAGTPRTAAFCRNAPRRIARHEVRCLSARGCRPAAAARLHRLETDYADRCVRLNQIQVLGTHNSYHVQPEPDVLAALLAITPLFEQIEYTHAPLLEQFTNQGIRQIEIDVYADPGGGLYSIRHGLSYIGRDPDSHEPALLDPGLKVIHLPDVDFLTRCLTFVDCLQTIKTWSDAHPSHLPFFVLVELKEDALPDIFSLGFVVPLPFDAAQLDTVDAEIRSVFSEDDLFTPDDLRGTRTSLDDAVHAGAWPTLAEARGKILFLMDNSGSKRALYRAGRPALEGRVLFTNAEPGSPDAAFVKQNDPTGDPDTIPDLVRAGYLVRTRADADTVQARSGDTTQRDAALASGAQCVSTDYPVENPAFGTGYRVQMPGGRIARCNPVNAPPGCRAAGLE